ncbi:MAG TPA: ECF transporter S component [Caproiciproducens sp.]|nr:ECF transporter S component [Caproiciproducens sp.]
MRASVSKRTLFLAQFAMLLAIEAIVCFTPLGSLPAFGPIVATLGMIPVIITAVVLGTGAGTAMGFFAGLFSFCVWTFTAPSPITAFVFTPVYPVPGEVHGNMVSLLICFVPRILVGAVTGACFHLFKKLNTPAVVTYGVSGVLGSLTNTLLVMGGIYVFFGRSYAKAIGQGFNALLGLIGLTVLTSGIPEAILGGLAAYAICYPIQKHFSHPVE